LPGVLPEPVWPLTGALLHGRDAGEGSGDTGETGRSRNVPAVRHFTDQDNGLVQPWEGQIIIKAPVDLVIVALLTGNL